MIVVENKTENELKYLINENISLVHLIDIFSRKGYRIQSISEVHNNDNYYDTKDLNLYDNQCSLRIREKNAGNKTTYLGTYKSPYNNDDIYSSRKEIEKPLEGGSFEDLKSTLKDDIQNFELVDQSPVLNSKTKRMDVILEKDTEQIALSYDQTEYTNYLIGGLKHTDLMLEVEIIESLNCSKTLNDINSFLTAYLTDLELNKQSKYERGILKTNSKEKNISL